MQKPSKSTRQKYFTDYSDKSDFASNARLLQSYWRENSNIKLERTYGNFLSVDQAYCQQLNFLTDKIRETVKKEIKENEKRKGKEKKVIKVDRLYENLLASQPLAFNLFAELITDDLKLANEVFRSIFSEKVQSISSIEFEISPGRGDLKYTGDRSAFDVFITYTGKSGKGFIGIEIKYAETLLDKPASFKDRYRAVSELSSKFTNEGIQELCPMPVSLEQIWRDHLLSLSMLPPVNNDYQEGFFVYLFPDGNLECHKALEKYYKTLKSNDPFENGLHIVTMEKLIATLKSFSEDKWIRDFEDRYLGFEKIENL